MDEKFDEFMNDDDDEVARVAKRWLYGYVAAIEEIDIICLGEGCGDNEWSDHVDFVIECFRHGLKPTHFVDTIIRDQQNWNKFFEDSGVFDD